MKYSDLVIYSYFHESIIQMHVNQHTIHDKFGAVEIIGTMEQKHRNAICTMQTLHLGADIALQIFFLWKM